MTWDEALSKLHQAPHAEFVAERKKLAVGDLKKLAKVGRPPISAWAVNQLWWQARSDFEAMLAAAQKVKGGSLEAVAEHKAALRKLHERAKELLEKEGNAASLSTLARVDTTLSAIAATGFEPDLPGTLSADRDPPGFSGLGVMPAAAPVAPVPAAPKPVLAVVPPPVVDDGAAARRAEEDAAKAAAAIAEAAARKRVLAQAEVEQRQARVTKLEAEVAEARAALEAAKQRLSALG